MKSRRDDPRCRRVCRTCEPPHRCTDQDREHGGICHFPRACLSSIEAMTPACAGDWAYRHRHASEASFLKYLAERRDWVPQVQILAEAKWGKGTNVWRLRTKLVREGMIEERRLASRTGGLGSVEVRILPSVARQVLFPTIQLGPPLGARS